MAERQDALSTTLRSRRQQVQRLPAQRAQGASIVRTDSTSMRGWVEADDELPAALPAASASPPVPVAVPAVPVAPDSVRPAVAASDELDVREEALRDD